VREIFPKLDLHILRLHDFQAVLAMGRLILRLIGHVFELIPSLVSRIVKPLPLPKHPTALGTSRLVLVPMGNVKVTLFQMPKEVA